MISIPHTKEGDIDKSHIKEVDIDKSWEGTMERMSRLSLLTISIFWAAASMAVPIPSQKTLQSSIRTIKLQSYLENLTPDQILEKMDSAGKNSPDIFVVFKKLENGTRQLQIQAFDLNRDGKVDLAKFFNNGKMVRTEMDLDYDGIVDVVSEYDPKTGELVRKLQADGSTNIWKYYFKNELRRKELDRNGDGKPDMWVYYRNGKILRTEIDQKFDGHAIRVEAPQTMKKAGG